MTSGNSMVDQIDFPIEDQDESQDPGNNYLKLKKILNKNGSNIADEIANWLSDNQNMNMEE